jgi:hypothetical protein
LYNADDLAIVTIMLAPAAVKSLFSGSFADRTNVNIDVVAAEPTSKVVID